MRIGKLRTSLVGAACLAMLANLALPTASHAKTAQEIDASVNATLDRFTNQVKNGKEVLGEAKGILVIPSIVKAAYVIGGAYGEGAMRIQGKSAAYYSFGAGSFGFQLGVQKMDLLLLFMTQDALTNFRAKSGWQAGVDGSIALINVGAGGSIDTTKLNKPIVGFEIGQAGLMFSVSLEGAKFTKLQK